MEHRSLYMVEELPGDRLCTPQLKSISSNDPATVRKLYCAPRKIAILGKLLINTNNCPGVPGDDTATWDRMVLIPWNTRYVPDGTEPEPEKWKLASDPKKMRQLTQLKDAFITVCLNEIHAFYKLSLDCNGIPTNAVLPIPNCIKILTKEKQEESFPLIPFIDKYLVYNTDVTKMASVDQVFVAYGVYMRRAKKKNFEDITRFLEKLSKRELEVVTDIRHNMFIRDRELTQEGIVLANSDQTEAERVYEPYNYTIEDAFQVQSEGGRRKRRCSDNNVPVYCG